MRERETRSQISKRHKYVQPASTHRHESLQHTQTYAHATYRLVLSSSSESIKLLDSSSLLSTVDALSGGSPRSRRRSPLGCPLVRAAVGQWGGS